MVHAEKEEDYSRWKGHRREGWRLGGGGDIQKWSWCVGVKRQSIRITLLVCPTVSIAAMVQLNPPLSRTHDNQQVMTACRTFNTFSLPSQRLLPVVVAAIAVVVSLEF